MKRQSKRIPTLPTDRAAAEYWDTHSLAEHVEDTREATIRFLKRPKRAISIRLAPEDVAKVEALAEAKGLSYTALLRMWIKERLAA
jgi:predicted DNA binding CopG/RHH family protein